MGVVIYSILEWQQVDKIDRCDIDLHAKKMMVSNHDFVYILQQIS